MKYFHGTCEITVKHGTAFVPDAIMMARGLKISFSLFLVLTYAMPAGHFHDMLVAAINAQDAQRLTKTRKPSKRKGILIPASKTPGNNACDNQCLAQCVHDSAPLSPPSDGYCFFCTDNTLEIVLPPPRA